MFFRGGGEESFSLGTYIFLNKSATQQIILFVQSHHFGLQYLDRNNFFGFFIK